MSNLVRGRSVSSLVMHLIDQTQVSQFGRWATLCGHQIRLFDLRMKRCRGVRNCKRCAEMKP